MQYQPYYGGHQPSSNLKAESKQLAQVTTFDEDDWEDVPGEQYDTIVEFSKCQDLVKMKKDFFLEKKSFDHDQREEDPKLLGKRTRVFVNDDFIETLLNRVVEGGREEKMIGLTSDLLQTQRGKTQWFEGNYYPVVGTSLIFEIKGGESKLISKQTDSFMIARKR